MSGRSRGAETRERVLEAACAVFAEKGFRDATHAEICRRAGANVAAVNYHFGSKEGLYQAVFDRLSERADVEFPLDGRLPPNAPARDRLLGFVRAHLERMFNRARLDALHRIRMAEMFDSTGLLHDRMEAHLAQDRAHILSILRELLGPGASKRTLQWCELSVVGQCFMAAPHPHGKGPREIFGIGPTDVGEVAEHIVAFSLAGIEAIAGTCTNSGAAAQSPRRRRRP